jgi:NADH:ubiquinone oxidoreductase subunit 6 (subunit J)
MLLAAINWHSFFFLLFAAVACFFALGVLFSSNVVRMAFYLVVSLAATAGLFMLAGAVFVGAMQIMIYVGGTLVLLIFGVMLTAQANFISMKTGGADWVMGLAAGGALLGLLISSAVSVRAWEAPAAPLVVDASDIESATPLGLGLVGVRVDSLYQTTPGALSSYLLPFEAIGIHLLVVLIGAAYLARAKRRKGELTTVQEDSVSG